MLFRQKEYQHQTLVIKYVLHQDAQLDPLSKSWIFTDIGGTNHNDDVS